MDSRLRVKGIAKPTLPSAIPPTHMFQQNPTAIHRYPTRFKTARAAQSTQLEQSQINNPQPVAYQYLTDIANPPSLLKYKDLIKTSDKIIWERGMCNELGRLAQGYKDIKGRNTIFFIPRSGVPPNNKSPMPE